MPMRLRLAKGSERVRAETRSMMEANGGPGDAHQLAGGGFRAMGRKPGDIAIEGVGMASIVAGRGDIDDEDAVRRAGGAGGVGR